MLRDEIKQLKTGARELRNFGLLVGGVFAALGIYFWLRGKTHFPFFLAPGALLMLCGLIFPRALKFIYIAWMTLAILLGVVVSTVLLTLFYFLVVTPIGLAARCVGKDFLSLKLNPHATSYWLPRERKSKSPADYERQF